MLAAYNRSQWYSFRLKLHRSNYALLVPLLALAVWGWLIPLQTGRAYLWLWRISSGRDADLRYALERVAAQRVRIVTAANMPGMAGEILVSLPTSWPSTWHPSAISTETWRALSLPFYCLPAWWFVGCGVEGLLGRRRLHWASGLIGLLLCLFSLTLTVGLLIEVKPTEITDSILLVGLALWGLAFAVPPVAWFRQRKQKHWPDP